MLLLQFTNFFFPRWWHLGWCVILLKPQCHVSPYFLSMCVHVSTLIGKGRCCSFCVYSVQYEWQIPNIVFCAYFKGSKSQTGRKRKQPVSSSGPANSSGTANTAGPSPSSAPSTPSTHTPGDVISMPALPHSGSSSKPLMMFGADGSGALTSPSNQLVSKFFICLYW